MQAKADCLTATALRSRMTSHGSGIVCFTITPANRLKAERGVNT
jgi:hypothetical protein